MLNFLSKMTVFIKLIFTLIILNITMVAFAQKTNDYLSVSEINLDNSIYKLSWSSHPNDSYYKQEYLENKEKPESYTSMVMLEVLVADMTVEEALSIKVNELKERQHTDQICNYQIIKNPTTGEYMIDFLMSSGNGNALDIVEWDVYHYTKSLDSNGNSMIVLFAWSKRAYGDDVVPFLKGLDDYRMGWINLIGNFSIPLISLSE